MQVRWDAVVDLDSQSKISSIDKQQINSLAVFLPDEILLKHRNQLLIREEFVGVLLFADMSGFTPLCERYSKAGIDGIYQMTATLNGYIGAIVEVIHFYKGDILKFSGDAFLALWKAENSSTVYDTIREVIVCALAIQTLLGSFETSVSVILKVKLAVSCGNLIFSVIGNETNRQYIITGTPIEDIKNAEHDSTSGDVIVASRAWVHCIEECFEYHYSSSGHVKITRLIYKPNEKRQQKISKRQFDLVAILCQKHIKHRQKLNKKQKFNDEVLESKLIDEFVKSLPQRSSIQEAYKHLKPANLLPFVISNIAQQIEERQSLEYMTEMRAVTIMFINIVPRTMTGISLISALDETYQIICNYVSDISGCVNKVSLFDKDVMFLVIFGLRGINHENESSNALKCACKIRGTISNFSYVLSISIGLTSGEVYCGVVGHPLRKEYTVIGDTVNKAARMMCAFLDRVTCDEETFNNAKLPSYNFYLKSSVKLKGITDSGKIFEYVDNDDDNDFGKFLSPNDLFIGRDEHINRYEAILNTCMIRKSAGFGLFFIGQSNIGKSRLLNELRFETFEKRSLSSTFVELKLQNLQSKNDAISLIYEQFYKSVIGKLKDPKNRPIGSLHHILNENGLKKIGPIFKDLIVFDKSVHNFTIIFLDNLHFIDQYSWLCVLQLLKDHLVLFVSTIDTEQSTYSEWITEFLKGPKTDMKMVHLNGLDDEAVSRLVFQFLKVDAIPMKLIKLLQMTAEGRPGWIQCCLLRIINNGSFEIKLSTLENISRDIYYLNDKKTNNMERLKVIKFSDSFSFTAKFLTQNKVLMDWFDSFSPRQQLIMKTGCVIGELFSRQMLKVLMNSPSEELLAHGIRELFDESVLECGTNFVRQCHGSRKETANEKGAKQPRRKHESIDAGIPTSDIFDRFFLKKGNVIGCSCDNFFSSSQFSKNIELYNLPKYAFCKLLHMKGDNLRTMTYKLLPLNQKKELHKRITNLLEQENIECLYCIRNRQRSKIQMDTFAESGFLWQSAENSSETCGDGTKKLIRGYLSLKPTDDFNMDAVESLIKTCVRSDIRSLSVKLPEKRKSMLSAKGRGTVRDDSSSVNSFNSDYSKKFSTVSASKSQFFTQKYGGGAVAGAGVPVSGSASISASASILPVLPQTLFQQHQQQQQQSQQAASSAAGLAQSSLDDYKVFRNVLYDRKHCYCLEILNHVYMDLIYHTSQAELVGKQIFYMTQRAVVLMMMHFYEDSISLLHEASELCTMDMNKTEGGIVGILPAKFRQYNFAKIHCLISESYLKLANLQLARNHLLLAFRQFDPFPRKSIAWVCESDLLGLDTSTFWEPKLSNYFIRYFKRTKKIMKRQKINVTRTRVECGGSQLQIAYCYFIMSQILLKQSRFKFARKTVSKSFRIVCKLDNNLEIFAEALRDRRAGERPIMSVANAHKITSTEQTIYEKWKQISFNVVFLKKLLLFMFEIEFVNGNILISIDLGLRVLETFSDLAIESIYKVSTALIRSKRLAFAVNYMRKMATANNIANCLTSSDEKLVDSCVRIHYYTFCLEVMLETGFELLPTGSYNQFANDYFANMKHQNEDIDFKFLTLMFVLEVRARNWKEAEKWRNGIYFLEEITDKYYNQFSYDLMYSFFKYIEGLLVLVSLNMNLQRPQTSISASCGNFAVYKIDNLDAILNVCHLFLKDEWEIFKPRCLHLIAYSLLVKQLSDGGDVTRQSKLTGSAPQSKNNVKSKNAALEFLFDAEKLARQQKNYLEQAWIVCNLRCWRRETNVPAIRVHKEFAGAEEIDKMSENDWAEIMYSLPLS